MKVTRKGSIISTLDADWLELTTFYYKQGLSLIDSFVCWEAPKGKLYISDIFISTEFELALKLVKMFLLLNCYDWKDRYYS
jgi:hypothetical protein